MATLNQFQAGGWFHPFTCAQRGEHPDQESVLVATIDGMQCPAASCAYEQVWVFAFMADAQFVEDCERTHREMLADLAQDMLRAYRCPACGASAGLVIGASQATCSNNDCHVIMFDPSRKDGGIHGNITVIDFP